MRGISTVVRCDQRGLAPLVIPPMGYSNIFPFSMILTFFTIFDFYGTDLFADAAVCFGDFDGVGGIWADWAGIWG